MLTFSITTTTKTSSICIHREKEGILGVLTFDVNKSHSITIMDQIERLFNWTKVSVNDINKVIVSVGPGSFTGVRIAVSIVKAMFYNKEVEVYEVNELDAMAYKYIFCIEKYTRDITVISMIDSNKEKIYYSEYTYSEENDIFISRGYYVDKLDNLLSYIDKEQSTKVVLVGNASVNYRDKITKYFGSLDNKEIVFPEESFQKVDSAVFINIQKRNLAEQTNIYKLKPFYLEKSQAERDKKNDTKKNI